MSLLQNVTRRAQYPIRSVGGASASPLQRTELGLNQFSLLSPHASDTGWSKTISVPSGWVYGNGWQPAQSAETLWQANIGAATTAITWALGTLNLAAGRNLDTLTYPCTVTFAVPNAQLQLIVSATGAVTAAFTTAGNVAGILAAAGTSPVVFTVGMPTIGAVADVAGALSFAFTLTGLPRADGALAGDVTPFTELSPQSLASAVGALLIEDNKTLIEVLRVCAAFAAGKTTVADIGGGQTEVTFSDLAQLKARITAILEGPTGMKERTSVTLDVS